MKEGRPSVTATFVALARAAASTVPMTEPPLHDSGMLLPRALRPLVLPGRFMQSVARVVSGGLVDHLALRSTAIDDVVVGAGARQIVLLGAGLDARAYRLPALADATIFEVDHPASQRTKQGLAKGLARPVTYIAADFGKDDLGAALEARGHDARLITAWVLEGVTMYLPESLTKRLLAVVGARSAPGSVLAATYMRPPVIPLPGPARDVVNVAMNVIGEPLDAAFASEAIAALLRAAGLEPLSDTSSIDWARRFSAGRFGASSRMGRMFRAERLVVARPVTPPRA